jgi:hypothetical protein
MGQLFSRINNDDLIGLLPDEIKYRLTGVKKLNRKQFLEAYNAYKSSKQDTFVVDKPILLYRSYADPTPNSSVTVRDGKIYYINFITSYKYSKEKIHVNQLQIREIECDDQYFYLPFSSTCFSFNSIATTRKGDKKCKDLVLGEEVLVGYKNKQPIFEPILLFGHKVDCESLFVELTLANGKKMSATPEHFVYTYNNKQRKLVHIKDIVDGDIVKYKGKKINVTGRAFASKRGIISPHTKSGQIVIDGVQASCYATEEFMFINNIAMNTFDALGVNIPQFIVDPVVNVGNFFTQNPNPTLITAK